MFSRRALIVSGFALAEYFVSARVVAAIGFGNAVLVSIALALLGIALIKASWRRAAAGFAGSVNPEATSGSTPSGRSSGIDLLSDAGLSTLSGVGLALPGFLSAILGALLVIPPIRSLAKKTIASRTSSLPNIFSNNNRPPRGRKGPVVDVETVDKNTRTGSRMLQQESNRLGAEETHP